MNPDVGQVVVAALVIISSVVLALLQVSAARKQAKITSDLSAQVQRLSVGLDQSLQRLHRAHDLVNKIHMLEVFGLYRNSQVLGGTATVTDLPEIATRIAKLSAYNAELRGVAFAIGDKALLDLVNNRPQNPNEALSDAEKLRITEMMARNWSQQLHTRIYQLLEALTREQNK